MDELFVEPDAEYEKLSEADKLRRDAEDLIKRLRGRIVHAESASLAIIKAEAEKALDEAEQFLIKDARERNIEETKESSTPEP